MRNLFSALFRPRILLVCILAATASSQQSSPPASDSAPSPATEPVVQSGGQTAPKSQAKPLAPQAKNGVKVSGPIPFTKVETVKDYSQEAYVIEQSKIVWRFENDGTGRRDSYLRVKVQSEAALRNLATSYPYDAHDDGQKSLRGNTAEVAQHLRDEIHERLAVAGVDVKEARISHLAYAPEIAAAMLQRQQASAIVAARTRIVDGAVGMVEMALERLDRNNTVKLDEERKAAMVSNLLVVLCGERGAQPVLNTGTMYH